MRIFFDTEFIEDGRTIDLVSIGLIREDGCTYYAQALGFDPAKASEWVKEHVLTLLKRCDPHLSLEDEIAAHQASGRPCSTMCPWRNRAELRQDLVRYAGQEPEFWADYASYDWVALAQIFGTMMSLPDDWPAWCRDVQQLRDGRALPPRAAAHHPEHHALNDARDCERRYRFLALSDRTVAA